MKPNTYLIKREPIKDLMHALWVFPGSSLVPTVRFQHGLLSAEGYGTIFQTQTELTCCTFAANIIPFKRYIDTIDQEYLRIWFRYRKIFFGTTETGYVTFAMPVPGEEEVFDLFHPEIQWLSCPPEIVSGIMSVSNAADLEGYKEKDSDDNEVTDFNYIYVIDNFVYAGNDYFYCRYALPYKSPIPMIFSHKGDLAVLKRLRKYTLTALSWCNKYFKQGEEYGIGMNFGPIRLCMPLLNNSAGFDRPAYIDAFDQILSRPFKYMVKVNRDMQRAMRGFRTFAAEMVVSFQGDRIYFYGKLPLDDGKELTISDSIRVESHDMLPKVSFGVDSDFFPVILSKAKWIGFNACPNELLGHDKDVFYFKNGPKETLLAVTRLEVKDEYFPG